MKSNKSKKNLYLVLGGVCALNFVAHLCFYPALPAVIPTHWGFDGAVDGTGPKWMALILAVLPFLMLALFRIIPAIDPKGKNYEKFSAIYNGFIVGMVVFFAALSWMTELAVFAPAVMNKGFVALLVPFLLGLLLLVMGNYMPRIKQNYTFGCKTPWALNDEHNWNRTHRMGGIVLTLIGAVCMVSGVVGLLVPWVLTLVMPAVLIGGILWIYLYSYLVFAGKMK